MIDLNDDSSLDVPPPDTMTPMIDVIFSLIAFMMLMINAPLLKMDFSLPQTSEKSQRSYANSEFVTLGISVTSNSYTLDGDALDSNGLESKLIELKQKGELKLMLKTDSNTPVQRMVDTLALLNRLNISNAQIALSDINGS
ncbi:ExbD/TolR family protein [Shewanella psychrotolerans]|uniref:ExbD/TolR family protein n=1 Tax=Shewanella psychrotolerans TaxID=2864206 RepID=UPI001C660EC5|nr:biopolymer transporter ExbD [Shewanella psychrotolerans]QYK00732.1 biopolymer transporter ExbD [Shewanella psychrotolerans]